MAMEYVALAGRTLLAVVFAVASYGQLRGFPAAERAMIAYGVPAKLARASAGVLLGVEGALSLLLILGFAEHATAIAAVALPSLFGVAIAVHIVRGDLAECHCFGSVLRERLGWQLVLRNGFLAALAVVILIGTPTAFSIDSVIRDSQGTWPSVSDVIPIPLLVTGFVLMYLQAIRALGVEFTGSTPNSSADAARTLPPPAKEGA